MQPNSSRQASIQTIADEQAGAEAHVTLRSQWNGYITAIAPMLAYSAEEIDRACNRLESSDRLFI